MRERLHEFERQERSLALERTGRIAGVGAGWRLSDSQAHRFIAA
jgi:hypothetical protein